MGIQEGTPNNMSSMRTSIVAIATDTNLTESVRVRNATTGIPVDDVYNHYLNVDVAS